MEDIKSTLKKLKPFIGKKADALWGRYNTGDKIEKQEWEQVINLLAQKYRIDSVEEEIVLPPPPKDELLGQITIGKTQYLKHTPQEFGLNFSELTRHLGIFGNTGTGKTTLAKNILKELIQHKIPFVVFDWGGYQDRGSPTCLFQRGGKEYLGENRKSEIDLTPVCLYLPWKPC